MDTEPTPIAGLAGLAGLAATARERIEDQDRDAQVPLTVYAARDALEAFAGAERDALDADPPATLARARMAPAISSSPALPAPALRGLVEAAKHSQQTGS